MGNNTVYEWILHSTFSVSARGKSLDSAKQYLFTLVHPDDEVLDLCCGTDFRSFWSEEQGAKVTGIDFATYLIALANKEAERRKSSVQFLEGVLFVHDLGEDRYDLISCLGNNISDFPISDFAKLGEKIASTLKPGGRFVLDYHDGSYDFMQGRGAREGVYQGSPERITFCYKEYLPEIGARVHIIRISHY